MTYALQPPQLLPFVISDDFMATYRYTGMNSNIFCNYRNVRVCQTINGLTEASAVPYSKTQISVIDFHQAVHSAFYLLSWLTSELIDLHKGSILSLGEERRRQ